MHNDSPTFSYKTMKQSFTTMTALFLFLIAQTASVQTRRFGLGVVVGEPTGISAKVWTSDVNGLDFGLGWKYGEYPDQFGYDNHYGETRLHLHVDYVWHSFDAIHSSERFPLYYGFGFGMSSGGGEDPTAVLRGVFGISWLPRRTPFDVFLEISPSLPLTNTAGLTLQFSIGSRYFF
jgi:hypothetical protein